MLEDHLKSIVESQDNSLHDLKEDRYDGRTRKTNEVDEFEYVNLFRNTSYFRKKHDLNLFPCDECDFQCSTFSVMEKHLIDSQHKAGRYMCKFCDFKTFKWKTLDTHMNEDHPVERLKCESCAFIGVSLNSLAYHFKTVHQGQSFSCDICSYKAPTRACVKVHKERVPYVGPTIECGRSYCDYKGTSIRLKEHIYRIHKSCDQCDYESNGKIYLKQHKRKVHGVSNSN